jgi:sulfur carrier protein ThiS adenylyltransferase
MNFEKIKSVLKDKVIGIAGCGGLGSNCAVALARTGIGKLVIADFDIIEQSNLNRQYYFHDQIGKFKAEALKENIKRINSEVEVEAHVVKLNESNITVLFKDCDIIVEAFDNVEMKETILRIVSECFPDKFLIMGIGMAGWGKSNLIEEKRYDKLIICGDEITEISENCLPVAPRVGIVANMQANVVLDLLLPRC